MVIAEVNRLGIAERTILQSFSAPMLEAIHAQAPDMATAWLVDSKETADVQLAKLSFQPDVYSPRNGRCWMRKRSTTCNPAEYRSSRGRSMKVRTCLP